MPKLTGRCLCEAISYEITGDLGPIYNCHCSKCRRWHGAAFRTRAWWNPRILNSLRENIFSADHSSEKITKLLANLKVLILSN